MNLCPCWLVALLFFSQAASAQNNPPPAAVEEAAGDAAAPEPDAEPLPAIEAVPSETEGASPEPEFPAAGHLWARFRPGAFRVTKTHTETFNPDGSLLGESLTTRHEVLKAVADDTYVLDVKATVDLDGKQIAGDWQTRVLRLATDRPGRTLNSEVLEEAVVDVAGESVSCDVWRFRYEDEPQKRSLRLFFNRKRFPHVLRRFERTLEQSDPELEEVEEMQVVSLATPCRLQGRTYPGCGVRWTRTSPKGRTIRLGFVCEAVPGGEVESRSTDTDPEGRVVRWSVTELVEFGPEGLSPAVLE